MKKEQLFMIMNNYEYIRVCHQNSGWGKYTRKTAINKASRNILTASLGRQPYIKKQ
jgi:hypothetical protein